MKIIPLDPNKLTIVAPLVASFRVTLKSFKGIQAKPDIDAAIIELQEYVAAHYAIYIAMIDDTCIGYIVCRVDSSNVWVESLYVSAQYRRLGVASQLFQQAEQFALALGEETLFNYVHPNNDAVISFLRKQDYSVLNLIEIRKPYKDEKLKTKINIMHNTFDY